MSLESANRSEKKVAIMQPYLFPYLGYFQLIHAVDYFVFYDDVSFIRQGWINRNRILSNGQENLFTVPILKSSSYIEINKTLCNIKVEWRDKFLKKIVQNYKKCPHFSEVLAIIEDVMQPGIGPISELTESSIRSVCQYLGVEKSFLNSSEFSPETKGMDRTDRLCEITKKMNLSQYINLAGGKALYTKDEFARQDVMLYFIESDSTQYTQQGSRHYIPNLSIIDVLMNNDIQNTTELLKKYHLS